MTRVQFEVLRNNARPINATPAAPQTPLAPLEVALLGDTKSMRANSERLASPQVVLLAILVFYRRWISPTLHSLSPGQGCKFLPTCSEYASIAIATHGALRGVALAFWRLLRCNPFGRGGLDPVPHRRELPLPQSISTHEPLP
jgi:hypothetical protein